MKGVILDKATLANTDLDMDELYSLLDEWVSYDTTSPELIAERIADADIIFANKIDLDKTLINGALQLKLIVAMATGTDSIDLAAARARNISVCNAQGYSTAAVAQHSVALMLALATQLLAVNDAIRAGQWQRSPIFCLLDNPASELAGKTLGIVGYGCLGKKVAQIARAFDMDVLVAASLIGNSDSDRVPMATLLADSDYISLHCPLTPHTKNLIDMPELKTMKTTARLINTARGGIVNEQALAQALTDGIIAGAGFDVLETEPPTTNSPLLSGAIPNLIITPHCAWSSREARQQLIDQIVMVVRGFLNGQPVQQVN